MGTQSMPNVRDMVKGLGKGDGRRGEEEGLEKVIRKEEALLKGWTAVETREERKETQRASDVEEWPATFDTFVARRLHCSGSRDSGVCGSGMMNRANVKLVTQTLDH